ncbi:MAG: hypothetical protein IPP66_15345 [Anaerolineales bacterium]|nr:hypothetical protein [Anaerolineales bacterium]
MKSIKEFKIKRQDAVEAFLVSLPILTYWVYWTLHPSYWMSGGDPGALYFIDSLSVFIGKSYVYVDHPGTPVQLIGSFLLALTYPFFQSREAFVQFFIARPGVFFLMANIFLLAVNLLCATVFYKTVKETLHQNRVVGAMAITLLFFIAHPLSYQSLTLWSHNSLNYPIGTLLLIWLYREMRNEQDVKHTKLILLGLTCGVLAIAQMYFFAWIVAGVFTIVIYALRLGKGFKQAIISGLYMSLGGLIGVVLMLIPIHKELPRFAKWLGSIITHLGIYGSGESGVFSLSLIPISVSFWWSTIRFMIILLLASLVLLGVFVSWAKRTATRIPAGDYSMVVGLLFQITIILLLMIKASVKLRYSLSLAGILPVLVFLIVKFLESTPWKASLVLKAAYILALAGVVLSLYNQKENVDYWSQLEKDTQKSKDRAVNRFAKKMGMKEKDVVVVYAYATPLKCAGLLHASNWTGSFKDELGDVCPNQHAVWDSNIELNTAVPVRAITDIDWDIVVWPGNGSDLPKYLDSVGAVNIPKSWNALYPSWFFIHSDVLTK